MISRALTIAGSDSGGGAGIQADLKTFEVYGVHGMSAITAVTAQNTRDVYSVQPINPKIVAEQITAVISDIGVDAIKTGMLYNSDIIRATSNEIEKAKVPIVVDPVMVSKSGVRLIEVEAEQALIRFILPLATVVTPNVMEAEKLANMKIKNLGDARSAAIKIVELGPKSVVIKGGHLITKNQVIDTLYWQSKFITISGKRIQSKRTHGTGCIFASAITAGLAKSKRIEEAVAEAKSFVIEAIRNGLDIGHGFGPANPVGSLIHDSESFRVLNKIKEGVSLLEASKCFPTLIPECQSNLAMALPLPKSPNDIAAIPGRIVTIMGRAKASSCPMFGASKHLASILMVVSKYDIERRASINLRFNEDLIHICESIGLTTSSYDRTKEPRSVKAREGQTTKWGTEQAIKAFGQRVPDIIYHRGDIGKEAMIILLGSDALDVAHKAVRLAEESLSH